MAVRTINTVEDNTAPPINLTLEREKVPIDITDTTVRLIIARGNNITNEGHQECIITSPVAGQIQYEVEDGDFPSSGNYIADVEIEYANGKIERLYDQLKLKARRKIR